MAYSREIRLQVLAMYALCGNQAMAGREFDISRPTVHRWVADALSGKDEEGAGVLKHTGTSSRARLIDATERMLLDVVEVAHERATAPREEPVIDGNGRAHFRPDNAPSYARVIIETNRAAVAAGKLTDGEADDADMSLASRARMAVGSLFGSVLPEPQYTPGGDTDAPE